jgi:2'-5' RNA ligase
MSPRAARRSKAHPTDPAATGSPWRLFLAVLLPPPVAALVGSLTAELAAEAWPVRWVAAEGAHLTLHFLGETAPERAELLRLALPPLVARHAVFDLRTAGLGVFPNPRRPRVLWLGLHGPTHRLETLHRDLGQALHGLNFPVDEGPFHPHVTLGRVRNTGTPAFPLRDLPDAIRNRLAGGSQCAPSGPPACPLPVREVALVRSHFGPAGSRYEVVGRYPLAPLKEGAAR